MQHSNSKQTSTASTCHLFESSTHFPIPPSTSKSPPVTHDTSTADICGRVYYHHNEAASAMPVRPLTFLRASQRPRYNDDDTDLRQRAGFAFAVAARAGAAAGDWIAGWRQLGVFRETIDLRRLT
ncbi:hypothetical protein ACOMHN_006057 [Nucella lapillus]